MRRRRKLAKPKVEAKPPVARKSPKSDGVKLRDLEKRLAEALKDKAEALEQETATADILRVISRSPSDIQPVFDAIVQNAVKLCEGLFGTVLRLDGDRLHLAAHHNVSPAGLQAYREHYPVVVNLRETVASGAILDRRVVQVIDSSDPAVPLRSVAMARATGFRGVVVVPMLRDGEPIGVINVARQERGPFTDRQVALLQTFADQAVIAIENVRLFNELEEKNRALTTAHAQVTEALEQQTATGEILRVISGSPTDVQPVFDTIVRSAARLCHAVMASVMLTDGRTLYLPANYGSSPEALAAVRARFPRPLDTESVSGAAILTRSVIHVPDVLEPSVVEFTRLAGEVLGYRSLVTVPMVREGSVVGAINVCRREAGRFTDAEVELLRAFADQAVIAIENVRLFKELQTKNGELTTALDQQTATSEILRAISSSLTDVQPVFNTIVESGLRLLGGYSATMMLLRDDDRLDLVAYTSTSDEADSSLVDAFPIPLRRLPPGERAIHDRRAHAVEDVESAQDATDVMRETGRARGWRGNLFVPMIRDDVALGLISITRREPGPFAADQIALLEIFAAQAVIAIENVRLFKELEARNRDLTATGEILQVISQSQIDVQPVFDIIAESALRLCEAKQGNVFLFDGGLIHLAAVAGTDREGTEAVRRSFPQAPGGASATTRAILTRRSVIIPDVLEDPDFKLTEMARAAAFRSVMSIPMLRAGESIGAITIARGEAGPFSDKQIAMLQTFADQAVIAIENVRLFKELEARNRDLTEALEQQTATSEVLKVISQSQTDVQPVFEAIIQSAVRLCDAVRGTVYRFDGELMHMAAQAGYSEEQKALFLSFFPRPPGIEAPPGRAILERAIVHIQSHEVAGPSLAVMQQLQAGSTLAVPLLRDGSPIGAIGLSRIETRAYSDAEISLIQTFADQAVIAIENVRLFTELQEKNQALTQAHAQVTESLEQQTATSEILRAISNSPTDVQPTFEAIAVSAAKLCEAADSGVFLFDAGLIHLMAHYDPSGTRSGVIRQMFPMPPGRGSVTARAILTRAVVHIPDIADDPEYEQSAVVRAGFRSVLSVPILRDDQPIGALTVSRRGVKPFSSAQLALLQTFADQALIAIENVRLFNETKEALEQQTATSEILRVIASSPTDIQPVFAAVAASAARLCDAFDATIFQIDGDRLRVAVHNGPIASHPVGQGPSLRSGTPSGRAVLGRRTIHVADTQAEVDEYPEGSEHARRLGFRTVLSVPLMREGIAIGVVNLRRTEVKLFTDRQVALLQTFADQAVIAIENVRLFTELQASNRELTAALDTQTATGDILRVISRSQTDVQPVFDAIVTSAVRLLGAYSSTLNRIRDDQIELVALTSTDDAGNTALRAAYPQSLYSSEWTPAHAMRDRVPLNIIDAQTDPRLPEAQHSAARARGYRSQVVVPLLRHDEAIGAIGVTRREAGGFTDDEIALLKTFADQAVIAIENARLLTELQARTQELTRSVDQLTALGDVGRAVSSSLDLDTVLTTIVDRAVQLSGTDGGTIFEYDEGAEEFTARATFNADASQSALLRVTRLRRGEGAVGQMAVTREPFQIPDISTEGAYESRIRGPMLASGTRSVLAIPLLHEERLVGGLVVTRRAAGTFTDDVVALLRTFATQSALAIQNARLFREIEDKSRQLEVASQHKSEFLANMSHELRTPLNAIIGFSEVLGERMFGDLNEKQDEYLKDIHASGQHLLSLINDILDLSKIEAGRMELELADFNLPATLDNALTLVRERAGRRGIALGLTVDERLEEMRADERKIRQVVLNLLSNAIKFTPEGGRIEVRAVPVDGMVEISVSDTGVGIAPEDQEAIFEEFKQVGTAAKKVEGTGLGLALSRKFIELHGGRIWVQSQVGVGSTFTFAIPIRSDA